jgi:hypothetical protein
VFKRLPFLILLTNSLIFKLNKGVLFMNQNNAIDKAAVLLNQVAGYGVSSKYRAITTQDVLAKFTASGFEVSKMLITKPRKDSKAGFQKHMLRLSHPSLELKGVGDSRPEIVIVNSYDGSSSLKIYLGVFRLVCSNGLIVGTTYGGHAIRHIGDVWFNIDKAVEDIKIKLPAVAAKIKRFQAIALDDASILTLAKEATSFTVPKEATSINLSSALRVRRYEDSSSDLWSVFNRLQEASLNGGISYQSSVTDVNTGLVSIKNNTTRRILSIDRQVDVNQKLWDLADTYSEVA